MVQSEELRQWSKFSDGWKGGRPGVRLDVGRVRSERPKAISDNLIRVKRKLLRRRKGVYESFSSRLKSRKSIILINHWILANLVKTYHGIIARQHPIHPRRVVLPKGLATVLQT